MTELINRHQGRRAVFSVRLRSGVWEVARDGAFFGDYLTRGTAETAARKAAAAFEAVGGEAQVLMPETSRAARRRS